MSNVIYAIMICEAMLGNTCALPNNGPIPLYFSLSECWTKANTFNLKSPQADLNHPRRVWQACYQRAGSSSTADWKPAEPTENDPPPVEMGEPKTKFRANSAPPVMAQGRDPPSGLPLKWVLVGIVSSLGPYPVALQSYPSLAECKQAVRVMQSTFNSPQPSQAAGDCVGIVLPTSVPR